MSFKYSLVELAQSLLVGPIPDVDEPVGASRSEGVVVLVEGDGVHGINVLDARLLDAVALEGIFLLLNLEGERMLSISQMVI